MGTCTSDIYKTAKKQYGEAFQKFIIHQQTQNKLTDWIRSKEQQYHQRLTSKTQNLLQEVDKRQQSLDNNFAESKLLLQSQLPYDVASFEQMKKISLQNLLGFNDYKKKLSQARNLINTESTQRKNDFTKKGEEILKKFEGEAQISQEKLKAFHDLPQEKRKFIEEKGVKEFETLINAKITEVQSKNADELNYEGDLKILENIISLKELEDVVNRSKSHFRTEIANIVGSNVDSSIQI